MSILPPELTSACAEFTQFYNQVHQHRVLRWIVGLGDVTITAHFGGGTGSVRKVYEIHVSTLQAIVLRLFDGLTRAMAFEEIQRLSGIEDNEILKRILHSLSCQKLQLLGKTSDGDKDKKISIHDSFVVNTKFTHPLRKFRMLMPNVDDLTGSKGHKSNGVSETSTPHALMESRGHVIEAAIVRIMKARRQLSHVDLTAEIMRHVTFFVPDVKAVKQRIERLIDKGFLERDETDAKMYVYVP